LDEPAFIVAGRAIDLSDPFFNLQFQISRARLVSAEAELESVLQMIKTETIRTPFVRSIQKGALRHRFGHKAFPTRRTANSSALCDAPREVENYQTKKRTSRRGAEAQRSAKAISSSRLCVRF
jgi:hypothetical protein